MLDQRDHTAPDPRLVVEPRASIEINTHGSATPVAKLAPVLAGEAALGIDQIARDRTHQRRPVRRDGHREGRKDG